ncbi:MAG: pilus assembly protein N-terminal domain-containing protein [Candidatus Omnitrophica bacterium]|nr:pilus assembly protein N-terminal domain-containing protein [Candidatus Omnitrophota bacterium]
MELGKLAMEQGDYQEAYTNFRHAQAVGPSERAPTFFINLIKRLQDQRVEPEPATKIFHPFKKTRAQIIDEALQEQETLLRGHAVRKTEPAVRGARQLGQVEPGVKVPEARPQEIKDKRAFEPGIPATKEIGEIIYLDSGLWETQPGTLLRVELESSIILEGNNVKRYLIITPDFIEVKRIDNHRLNVIANNRGATFLHVWDDRGRWTFNVEVILPVRKAMWRIKEEEDEGQAEPFRLSYSNDWSSYYRGPSFKEAERENLNFLQRAYLEGETPYGDWDSHVVFNKFEESTEVTGYGVALTEGKIGNFKDFSIYGFDLQKVFSPLTMPGQYVRGVLFEAKAFNKNLEYAYIHGRDRAVYGFLSPDVLEERESFVEGGRVTLFPEKENQYSVNYVRGYGNAREEFLKDQVFSVEAQRRVMDVLLSSEFAYDESAQAVIAGSVYKSDNHNLTVNFRDIEDDFTTITSFPGRRGEVGGSVFWNWRLSDININTYLDLYRERLQPNPEALDTVNVDFNTRADIPIFETDRLMAALYYVDTSGELTPRNNIQSNIIYTKRFPGFRERDITAFVGAGQQRSRFNLSPSSEYDRYSASSGLSIPFTQHLNYYANFEHSWVYEEQSGDLLTPNVFTTGINFSKKIFDEWSVNSGFNYRNEENTEGTNSFLAGEDSITGSIGAAFRPNDDFEFFIDGRAGNVWGQEEDRASFNEYDIRAGIRTSWETPFRWNPKGVVRGIVYKDLNGNQRQDTGEAGIPDVTVKIGKLTAVTDAYGYYHSAVRAKSAEITLDINSIPDGFIFSTPMLESITIVPHKVYEVDFGLTTQSGIYGVVFFDKNKSGKPDPGDEFIADARITLDDKESKASDFEGTYFFENIQPGKHTLTLDVNSLPVEYLPEIKLKNTINTSEGSIYVFHIPLNKTEKK